MKHFCTLFALFMGSQLLQAQITIERSDLILQAGDRSFSWDLDITGAVPPLQGEEQIWDYSNLNIQDSFFTDFPEASSTDFPDAHFSIRANRGILSGLAQQSNTLFYELNANEYRQIGEINDPLDVPLLLITGSLSDTLKIMESKQFFPDPKIIMQFPLNYGDNWVTDNTTSLNFLISVAAFGLQNAPSGQTIHEVVTDSIVGYGTLILPNPDGSGSVSIESLLAKRTTTLTLNYTLAGQPAPQVMLDALGLQQGATSSFSTYIFYAKGLRRSAATVGLDANGNVAFLTISDDVKDLSTSTQERSVELLPVKVFPNPAHDAFQMSFDKPDSQNWTLEMFNILGQQVHRQSIDEGIGFTQVGITCPTLRAGHYTYLLRNRAGQLMATGTVLLQ